MKRLLARVSVLVIASSALLGQSPGNLKFETADVYVSPHTWTPRVRGGLFRGGRFELRDATMVDLISTAYGVAPERILEGPSWLEWDRFDVVAKAPASSSNEAAKSMVRDLLADRFKLKIHNDTRPIPVYALTVVKQPPQMKPADGSHAPGCQSQRPQGIGNITTVCSNITMAALADSVKQWQPGYFTADPVVDLTGLQGEWDFTLKWTPKGQLAIAGSGAITLFDAFEKQLGLKMEPQQRPAPVIVVDGVNQKPTNNASDVVGKLPAVPTEFEAAVIKPSMPGTTPKFGIPGGRLEAEGYTLKQLIGWGWDLYDDMVVGPKWLDTTKFDITAKAPENASVSGAPVDDVTFAAMLRALLMDRFKMKVHMENQSVSVYELATNKREPKLMKADASTRTACKAANAGPSSQITVLAVGFSCTNMTMSQLADRLTGAAPGYIDHPVINSTGLQGAWDFTLTWTGRGAFNAATTPSADPNGSLSIFEAVDKQLGLKLDLQKRPMPVLVLDHVEQTPTAN